MAMHCYVLLCMAMCDLYIVMYAMYDASYLWLCVTLYGHACYVLLCMAMCDYVCYVFAIYGYV